jgi:tRNA pseudouridine38-40 synthase
MPNLQLVLEYDGTRYHGWQRQPKLPTVQGAVEEAVAVIAGNRIPVYGAGRTDAGVHAEGQVGHFKTKSRLPPDAWHRALNSLLPEDIVVRSVRVVPDRFHARFSALGKVYRYRILNRRYAPAIGRQYVWTVYSALNLRRMRTAAAVLIGRHDFSSFQGSDPSRKGKGQRSGTAICRVGRLDLRRHRDAIDITIAADRFLQQMVRAIVGTLVQIGRGKRPPGDMKVILKRKDRRCGGPTAPPMGLCLVEVRYR